MDSKTKDKVVAALPIIAAICLGVYFMLPLVIIAVGYAFFPIILLTVLIIFFDQRKILNISGLIVLLFGINFEAFNGRLIFFTNNIIKFLDATIGKIYPYELFAQFMNFSIQGLRYQFGYGYLLFMGYGAFCILRSEKLVNKNNQHRAKELKEYESKIVSLYKKLEAEEAFVKDLQRIKIKPDENPNFEVELCQ